MKGEGIVSGKLETLEQRPEQFGKSYEKDLGGLCSVRDQEVQRPQLRTGLTRWEEVGRVEGQAMGPGSVGTS